MVGGSSMSPNHINWFGLGPSMSPKHTAFNGLKVIDVTSMAAAPTRLEAGYRSGYKALSRVISGTVSISLDANPT